MALPSSGTITLAQIQTEFGGSNPISLSEYYRGGAYVTANNTNVPTSGTIRLSNFYGAQRQFSVTISGNLTDANLRIYAVAQGWDQTSPLKVTVASGVYISGTSTGTPALTVSGSFPGGVTLVNNGFILGRGGAGGKGGDALVYNSEGVPVFTGDPGAAGSTGGTAILVTTALSIDNTSGTIAGGGGGGGGGGGEAFNYGTGGGGGGGGRSSLFSSAGGSYGVNLDGPSNPYYWGTAGSAGTSSTAGAGGAGRTLGNDVAGAGGNGGGWGAAGSTGVTGSSPSGYPPTHGAGGAGGAAGTAVSGNSNVTWIAVGTRLGPLT